MERNESISEELFYSPAEKIAFYITPYYLDSNSNVGETIKNMQRSAQSLLKACKRTLMHFKEVKSSHINQSSRYKYQRVFWLENVQKCPTDAFEITEANGWTMWKWLNN